jgi:hypothetical protein
MAGATNGESDGGVITLRVSMVERSSARGIEAKELLSSDTGTKNSSVNGVPLTGTGAFARSAVSHDRFEKQGGWP